MIKVKVCGLSDPSNVKEIAGIRPDFMGFIFYRGSARYVGEKYDPLLFKIVPSGIFKVGVFLNEKNNKILEISEKEGIDFIQLHGNETARNCAELKSAGLKIIKAFSIDNDFDFNTVKVYLPFCEYFLFDTKHEKFGGSGKKFNWSKLEEYKSDRQFFLSGGIGPGDTAFAEYLFDKGLFGLDINSRFEASPGIKDVGLVDEFIKTIQNYQL
jgi:phosphoribosylanthranilate isomerase